MRDLINLLEAMEAGCPPATQSIELNLKNRQKAIDEYGYGPLDPNAPNREFWATKADEWNLTNPEEAKSARCGNCAAFDETSKMQDCIARGIGSEPGSDPRDTIDAGTYRRRNCPNIKVCWWFNNGGVKSHIKFKDFAVYLFKWIFWIA